MKTVFGASLLFALSCTQLLWAAAAPPRQTVDALGRSNPRGTVTGFLQSCHQNDYRKASEYLDLSQVPVELRSREGPELARDLEAVLNADNKFDALLLSNESQGNLGDDADPNMERVGTINANDHTVTLELQRQTLVAGTAIWLFSAHTVAQLPQLVPLPTTESAIEARLPRFLVSVHIVETGLWKWIALLLLAALVYLLFRIAVRILKSLLQTLAARVRVRGGWDWLKAVVEPFLVLIAVSVFKGAEEFINPSALGRLYIGRFLLMAVVWSIAWSLINLYDLFLTRLDFLLNPQQRQVAHSLIYLARRVGRVLVVCFAAVVVLDNWNIRMTTIIAGLGVGGIAVALAAQQTLANIFGGVSVIGDSPVMIGDLGNFGGIVGYLEEIGMRSTRVRTFARSIVSVPNSNFAGMNLENYAVRDKILFNPTIAIKRDTPHEKIRGLMQKVQESLTTLGGVEAGPSCVRLSAYSAASFGMEVFAYVLTSDMDEFYKRQADLYLAVDDAVRASGVELV